MNFNAFKMDGLGNDFLIIDNRKQKVYLNEKQIQKLSNRENGIGFDQLIYIEKFSGLLSTNWARAVARTNS